MVVGGQLAGRVRGRATVLMTGGAATMGAVFLVVALALPGPLTGIPLYLAGGIANAAFVTAASGIILASAPETEQARVWAAYRWIITCCLMAGFAGGGAIGQVNSVAAVVLCGVLAVGGAGVRSVVGLGRRRPVSRLDLSPSEHRGG